MCLIFSSSIQIFLWSTRWNLVCVFVNYVDPIWFLLNNKKKREKKKVIFYCWFRSSILNSMEFRSIRSRWFDRCVSFPFLSSHQFERIKRRSRAKMKFFFCVIVIIAFSSFIINVQSLKCYDCLNCPFPWTSFATETYGSLLNFGSRVKSCYVSVRWRGNAREKETKKMSTFLQKKEFYNAVDRRLDRVSRGALNGECRPGKFENVDERSITYCCYSNLCNTGDFLHRNRTSFFLFFVFLRAMINA